MAHKLMLCGLVIVFALVCVAIIRLWNIWVRRRSEQIITEKDKSSIFVGYVKDSAVPVHLKEEFRTAHTQVIGTTNAGKTASIILPWAVQDIEQGRGVLIVDGKADRSFLDKIYSHAVACGRQDDFMVFSLALPQISSTYNPFCDGTPEQITERIFSAFNLTDPYYGSLQFSALRLVVTLLMQRGEKPMPGVIRELLRNKEALQSWMQGLDDTNLIANLQMILKLKEEDFEKNYSGLVTALGSFSEGVSSSLYNTKNPEIKIIDILKQKKICYFQLPTMQFPFLGAATGKLVLQNLQSAVSEIQVQSKAPSGLFSVYLDDFNDYIYPAFASLLNKSRSAGVGVVFSHQSLGDLEKVSADFKQIILTNTNIKVIMRSNDPETAEHFSKSIGTKPVQKITERKTRWGFWHRNTGEQSVREVEEFIYHPNLFKTGLGRGEGITIIPHPSGTVVKRILYSTTGDVPIVSMPVRDLPKCDVQSEAFYRGISSVRVRTISKAA